MNIYDFPNQTFPAELCDVLLENDKVRIEKIVSDGHTTAWLDQSEDEWVCLLKGNADIEFDKGVITLCEGDTIFIKKHNKHRVIRTTKCIWLCVFTGE
jgi:cupin 2 domain-containing protein